MTTYAQQWPLQYTAVHAPRLFELVFDAPLIGVLKRWPDKKHAVTMNAVVDGSLGRGTFTSACGMTGLRLDGAMVDDQLVAARWPPRLQGMPDRFERCRDCWLATGRMRPRTNWKSA